MTCEMITHTQTRHFVLRVSKNFYLQKTLHNLILISEMIAVLSGIDLLLVDTLKNLEHFRPKIIVIFIS